MVRAAEPRDGARRGEVELRGGDREHVGVVVEAGVRRLVARQQRRHVQIQGQQIANRVAVLGPVQAVDGARSARIGVRGGRAVDVRFEPARHGVVGRKVRTRASRRRHRAGPQLRDHPLPDVGVAARIRSVDSGRVQAQPAGPEPAVVAGDAVAVQDRAGRDRYGLRGRGGRLFGRRTLLLRSGSEARGRGLDQRAGRQDDGAGHHEHGGCREPGDSAPGPAGPAPSATVRSRHSMLLEVCGRSNIETHASRRIVLRDEGPGNIESPPRCGAAGDGHAALRRGRRARGSRRKPRNEDFDLRRVALGTEHPALRTEQRCCVYTIVFSLVQFAWDERKSQANLRERGFDFAFGP